MFLFNGTTLKVSGISATSNDFAFSNRVFFNPNSKTPEYVQFSDTKFVYKTDYLESTQPGFISMNSKQREIHKKKEGDNITFKPYTDELKPIGLLSFQINLDKKTVIDCETLSNYIKSKLGKQPLSNGQEFSLFYNGTIINFLVEQIELDNNATSTIGLFNGDTNCIYSCPKNFVELTNRYIKSGLFKKNLDLQDMGIGGLDKEFQQMFRRAFVSRMQKDVAKKMGIGHVKGILLYGPPGCGKTLLARELGKLLNCKEPKIVSGPELLNKYVGASEEKVRELFVDAMNDPDESNLYLIICDEFDALCKQRGSNRGDAGVGDNIVNQFLTMIDGPKQLNNILLICMTNRKDLIDDAILRAGRIEVHIEIQLPDQKGREDILMIHTKSMTSNKYLDKNVSIKELASLTKNYTGAELAGLVKSASSFALVREVDLQDKTNKKINPVVTMQDFTRAIDDIIPMFGKISNDIQIITSSPFIFWSHKLNELEYDILGKISGLRKGNISTILITGPTYVGKTKFISHVAKKSGVPCVKMITTERLIKSSMSKASYISDTFEKCIKADTSILIFDGLERIIEWLQIGPRFNNEILQTIISIMTNQINPEKKCVLVFTANDREVLENLGMIDLFDTHYDYPTTIPKADIKKHFPCVADKCGFLDEENISDVFKYMKYV